MADLLPSLSSDDENNNDGKNTNANAGGSDSGDDDDDASAEVMDETFQFGGILGEDGVTTAADSATATTTSATGWSFQTALDSMTATPAAHPRLDIDALIAAKRKSLRQQQQQLPVPLLLPLQSGKGGDKNRNKNRTEDDNDSDDNDNDIIDKEQRNGKDGGDDGNDDDDESSSSSSSDDEERDDAHRDLEDDVLTTRAGKDRADKDDKVDKEGANGNEGADDATNEHDGKEGEEEEEEDEDEDDISDGNHENEDTEERKETAKADAFFDSEAVVSLGNAQQILVFAQLTLSRPLLRGVAAMGFVQPTPIQAAVIPLALQGRDICASAVTGSGKTAAFLLPVAERLLHRHPQSGRTRALVLTPTRELAAQCLGMLATLCTFTKLRAALIVGGSKNLPAQAAELRTRPDFVVATPGRLLDHVTNSTGVSLDEIEFLVLDEADRLLDLGFQDEIMELVKACPVVRQTLLFSATMNTKVDDLIQLSLKSPVRVRISDIDDRKNGKSTEVAPRLEQEFVRVRAGNEGANREGMLLALLTRTYTQRVIVFFDTKAAAHRLMILAGLCGIKCAELHGNLTQQQRLTALEDFRRGETVDVLLATDLAARGLDIDKVQTVVNFEMPSQIETYVHRIGRTARAGRGGRSCTLIGEGRRHLMKELIRDAESSKRHNSCNSNAAARKNAAAAASKGVIRSRSIPAAVIAHFSAKIQMLEPHLEEVLQAEAVARMDRIAEMEAIKAQNIIEHSDEIKQRPQREWFATKADKRTTREAVTEKLKMIAEKAGTGMHRMTRKKRRAREALEDAGGGSDNDEHHNEHSPAKVSALKIKSDVRKQKRKQVELDRETAGKSIRDHDVEQMQKAKRKKKSKAVAGDAAGDSSLFNEERVSYAAKKETKSPRVGSTEEAVAKSTYNFIGYDPDKKLGKKKSHKAFKSKSKHKRR